jgi:hypothetical protein
MARKAAQPAAPPYLIDVDTLARWLVIQCGSVREARKVVTRNADAVSRPKRCPAVSTMAVCLLSAQIHRSEGGAISIFTAVQKAARKLIKDERVAEATIKRTWRFLKKEGVVTK